MCFVHFTASQKTRVAALQRNGWEVFLAGWQTRGQTAATVTSALWLLGGECNTAEKWKCGVVECKGNRGPFTVIREEQTQFNSLCSRIPAQFYVSNENGIFHCGVVCYLSELRWQESFPISALSQVIGFCFPKVQFQINLAKTLIHSFQKILQFFNVNFNIWIPRNTSS